MIESHHLSIKATFRTDNRLTFELLELLIYLLSFEKTTGLRKYASFIQQIIIL